jgi:uvrD rep family helicase
MERRKRFWTEQRKREYIREAEDNLFIVAGPGTGKTTLLSKRILNQIMGGERLSHFLLLAFTDEAVAEFKQKIKKHLYREIAINKEMSQRLKRKIYGIDSMHITTFRDFCQYVLGLQKGAPDLQKDVSDSQKDVPVLQKDVSDLQKEVPDSRKDFQDNSKKDLAEGQVASDRDLEEQCYKLLQGNSKLLQTLRRDFTKIYADELQDLSQTQLDILLLLSTDKKGKMRHNCLFMVGDPRQTIYQEEEAERQVFFQMKRRMEKKRNVKVLYLNENYRSNAELIDWINQHFRKRMPAYHDMKACQKPEFLQNSPLHGVYQYPVKKDSASALQELMKKLLENYSELRDRDFLILSNDKNKEESYKQALKPLGFSDASLNHMVLDAHASKGLNSNIVILMETGGDSCAKANSNFTSLEYVAVTRAKHALIFLQGKGENPWFCDSLYNMKDVKEIPFPKS